MKARVVEILLDKYRVRTDEHKELIVGIRGIIKRDHAIKVGDIVSLEESYGETLITKIHERKNDFIRPSVANIDNMYIIVATKDPILDPLLLDKQIILAESKDIKPIIVVNKTDLDEEDNVAKHIEKVYGELGYNVIKSSVEKNEVSNIDFLGPISNGELCAFSGRSGVGKSSIIKKLADSYHEIQIGEISKKSKKGKHTTRSVVIYEINENNKDIYLLDTPGFSSFEIYDIESKELKDYYPEFNVNSSNCNYIDCSHIGENEKECAIKREVKDNRIDKGRYERYIKLYNELKEKELKKYK
ncbi:MAG: ribosome small subunit-dependent GTPase A [Clostridia bacterium]|nr:ribosome small subunit-dependent GTPase A [Clostridia bacterium]MDD4376067.1 ribosome small subunit-dependent GTPase A [Clostridia bacterium]